MRRKPDPMYRNPSEEQIAPDRLWGRFWICVTLLAGLNGIFLGTWIQPFSAATGVPWWLAMGACFCAGMTGVTALSWGFNGYSPRSIIVRWAPRAALAGATALALGFLLTNVTTAHSGLHQAARVAGLLSLAYSFFWAYHMWRQVVRAGKMNEPTVHPATKTESEQHGTNILLGALCAAILAAGLYDAVLIGYVAKFGPLWFVVTGICILQPQLFIWTRIPEGEIAQWREVAGALGAASAVAPAGVLLSAALGSGVLAVASAGICLTGIALLATRHVRRGLYAEPRGVRTGLLLPCVAGIALSAGAALIRLIAHDGLWETLLAAWFGVTGLTALAGILLAANTRVSMLGWPDPPNEEDARPVP